MKEDVLHFAWKLGYFNQQELQITNGNDLIINKLGVHNHNSGPDFSDAKIKLDNLEWAGNIELHVFSSDWYKHKHHNDLAYDSVILHVVWEHDRAVFRTDGSEIPTLELKGRIPQSLLGNYQSIQESLSPIPCQEQIHLVDPFIIQSRWQQMAVERLKQKAETILELFSTTGNNWIETTFQLFVQSLGFKVNSPAFLALAQQTPYKVIQKHKNSLFQLESILFGQSGLLPKQGDEYVSKLQKEYKFLQSKYQLTPLEPTNWKFLRMRPSNFPTVRIAQLATLLHKTHDLFSTLLESKSTTELLSFFDSQPSEYWLTHYRFQEVSKPQLKRIGESSKANLIINTVAPLLAAYGIQKKENSYIDKAISFLDELPTEENKITRKWNSIGINLTNAVESQAAIQQFNEHCTAKKCLTCSIGYQVLRGDTETL
ncbi:MAG: DUF2851 family protein [Cyclobacteriaceae bacterium]